MQPMNWEIISKFHDNYIRCLKVLKKCTKLCTFGSEREKRYQSQSTYIAYKSGALHPVLLHQILAGSPNEEMIDKPLNDGKLHNI